jgi:hypothetical protein
MDRPRLHAPLTIAFRKAGTAMSSVTTLALVAPLSSSRMMTRG